MRRVRYSESKARVGEISLLFVVIIMVGFAVMLAAGAFHLR
jgi:hypothetical protein